MSRTHLIIPDVHCHFQHHNNRAVWLADLIADVKPDVVINLGDTWDMPSLSSYDKGKKQFQGRTYKADIDAGLDFHDRLFSTLRKKKKRLPRFVFLVGNHEQRIDRAIDIQPELDGVIGYADLKLEEYYNDVIHYNGRSPGTIEIDGVYYAHFMVSGILGQPVSGEHQAYSLLSKHHTSCTVGHTHTYDNCIRTTTGGRKIYGLVAGCYIDYEPDWAGQSGRLWWSGVFVKRSVENGQYDLEAISIDRLRREYGR